MIADLPPHSEYKDSGVPWLGEIPEGWEVRRIKTLFREKDQRSGDGAGVLLSLTRAKGIVPQADASNRMASAEDLSKYKVCRPGDLVMNRMQAWSGMFALSQRDGLVSPDYSVFEASGTPEVKYFEHLFKTPILVDEFARRSKGIGSGFNRLYTPDFGAVAVSVPPLAEQAAIVRFLDHFDRRIRHYIAAKKKLIALLNEQKQAIIQRAVTRGLNPNLRLKPSGVEWLGDVPEHWTVTPNKAVMTPRRLTVGSRSKDFTLLSLTLRGIIPRDLENPEGKFPADFGTYQVVEPDDLVFCLFDMDETPRTVGIAHERGMVTGAYSVFECIDQEVADFLYRFYLAMDAQKRLRPFYTGLRKVVQQDTFLSIKVAIPPTKELREILSFVATEMAQIDGAIARTEREVDLVGEYRTRLIADVVTGKLDVRDVAARLPEDADEAELLNDAADIDASEVEADLDTAAVEADA